MRLEVKPYLGISSYGVSRVKANERPVERVNGEQRLILFEQLQLALHQSVSDR